MKKMKKLLSSVLVFAFVVLYTFFEGDISETVVEKQEKNTPKVEVNGNLEVHFIDVGQADSILITANNKGALIDAGNSADGKLIIDYINNLGIEKLDFVIATHPHEDHIGGMDDVLNAFKADKFYMPDVLTTTKTFENMLDALENQNLKYTTPKIGSTFNFEGANFEVLYVGKDAKDLNNTSIVVKMTYGEKSFLFTGDAEDVVEKQILNKDLKSDVLKVGHHGSEFSTTDEFLEKVNPEIAVISVGTGNKYKHPNKTIIDKLNKNNIDIYRTDKDKTIIIKTDGKTLEVLKNR